VLPALAELKTSDRSVFPFKQAGRHNATGEDLIGDESERGLGQHNFSCNFPVDHDKSTAKVQRPTFY
jgi:hypothetical protein